VAAVPSSVLPAASTSPDKQTVGSKLTAAGNLAYANLREYADDFAVYEPRVSVEQRFEFWAALQENDRRKLPPKNFKSW